MLASRDDLSIVLDNVADGVTVQDRSGQLVYANFAAARVLGFASQQELLATPAAEILRRFEIVDEDGQPLPLGKLPGRLALEGLAEAAVTLRFRRLPDGEERWSSVRATPLLDADGRAQYAVNVWHDVTAQKRIEHRQRFLVQAGELLASSLDVEATLAHIAKLAVPGLADWCAVHLVRDDRSLAQVAVAHVDPERAAWARQLQERYSTDPDAPFGVPQVIRSGRPELVTDVTDEMLVAAARDEEHLEIARRVGMRSAVTVPLVVRERALGAITLVTAESGRRYEQQDLELLEELGRRAAMAIENARLFNAERAARNHAQDVHLRFRALFEGMPDAILVLDDDESVIDANAGACDLLGYDGEELILMPVTELIADPAEIHAGTTPMALDEWRGVTEVRRRDGERVPVELWFRKLTLPSGTVRIGALRDISERRAADKAREEVLAAVSHDLRNPIGVIKGHVQLMLRMLDRGKAPEPERLRDRLASIDAMGSRMVSLLEDMTDVARSRRGEPIELVRKPTDLVALARRSAEELAIAGSRDIQVDAGAETLVGLWDARGVERVIHNLVQNAVKYSPEGGGVSVRVARADGGDGAWAELAVLDEGIGIPEGDHERIFDPYFRGSNVGGISGTGIGLAGARTIVEAQGGTITVAGREGPGTVVTVRLPLEAPTDDVANPGDVPAAVFTAMPDSATPPA
jgi:PAS domain S-box-containing protein